VSIAKIFKYGNSHAVRLPKHIQFDSDEIEIIKHGKEIIIREIPKNLARAFKLLTKFPDDFFPSGRKMIT